MPHDKSPRTFASLCQSQLCAESGSLNWVVCLLALVPCVRQLTLTEMRPSRPTPHLDVEQEDVISDIALDEAKRRAAIWTGHDVKFGLPQNGSQGGKRFQIVTDVQDSLLPLFLRRPVDGSQHMS